MRGRGFGRPGGWQQADLPDAAEVPDWFAGRLPSEWFTGTPTIDIDRDEIVVIGELPIPKGESAAEKQTPADTEQPTEEVPRATKEGLVARFRESTRPARMQIAQEAQARFGRSVAWGVSVDGERILFTHLAVPVMTRLRQPERKVLDTLVDAGVARSRADALAWTVKLAGEHAEEWLEELRTAMRKVDDLRAEGPRGL
ncbi:transcriptional regulator AbmR [Nocardia thraciensis]